MLIKITSLLLSVLLMQQAFATTPSYKDTVVQPRNYRLTEQQFLEQYGANDTSRALIQYYFEQRKRATIATLVSGIIGGGTGIAFDNGIRKPRVANAPDVGGGFYGQIFLVILITAAGTVFLVEAFNWLRFSRKRLLKLIQKQRAGKSLPPLLFQNSAFRKYLDYRE